MNNDATPVPAADLSEGQNPSASASNGITNSSNGIESALAGDPQGGGSPSASEPTPAQARATSQMKKRYEFINLVMANLDMLIYVELCIIYYMDCSFFRFVIRVLAQVMFLTPKPSFVPPMPKQRPYIGAIFGPNIICILLHIFTARSEAGEAMRGYLHGGIIIDLIGQKGPSSKIHLVLLDLLITALQSFMLAVHIEREKLRDVLLPKVVGALTEAVVAASQDHDAEERGVLRDAVMSNGDIELQPLSSARGQEDPLINERTEMGVDRERERLLAELAPREEAEEDDYPLDVFYSGTAIVGDFHVLQTLRSQWTDYGNSPSSGALQTIGFTAGFAAATADRRVAALRGSLSN
ncbi:hypothetical protein BP5796_07508 [Coleophoma crateriformis]|uniref:DUF1746 domain-containing protein n=1 Tax=Coleophoma crateriformis TaxID=565419 RepID=A0A3D8RJC9_9HELO|nr:hypothetical protein BP5796_07508 [Coleophoma crateriformis]